MSRHGSSLSPRLRAIGDAVLPGEPVADIGTDHAKLPIALVASQRVPKAIACDRAFGPLAVARRALEKEARSEIELRAGEGLAPIRPGEVATLILAGMGAATIRRILSAHPEVVAATKRLVLQPNTDWAMVRAHVAAEGWGLDAEVLVEDAGKYYVVLSIDPTERRQVSWSESDLRLGPHLRRARAPAFISYLEARIQQVQNALSSASAAHTQDSPGLLALRAEFELLMPELRRTSTPRHDDGHSRGPNA